MFSLPLYCVQPLVVYLCSAILFVHLGTVLATAKNGHGFRLNTKALVSLRSFPAHLFSWVMDMSAIFIFTCSPLEIFLTNLNNFASSELCLSNVLNTSEGLLRLVNLPATGLPGSPLGCGLLSYQVHLGQQCLL